MIFSVTIVFVSITKSDVSREFIPHETSILLAKNKKKFHVNLLFKIYAKIISLFPVYLLIFLIIGQYRFSYFLCDKS